MNFKVLKYLPNKKQTFDKSESERAELPRKDKIHVSQVVV